MIVAEDVEGEALATLVVNNMRVSSVAAVQAPALVIAQGHAAGYRHFFVWYRRSAEKLVLSLENAATLEHLGQAQSVQINKDNSTRY